MVKCPYCSSVELKSQGNGEYECLSCGSFFEENEKAKSAYISSQFKQNNKSSSMSNGEKVYDACIAGVAAVVCQDIGCAGSGFLISSRGEVLTNAHVVQNQLMVSKDIICQIAGESIHASVIKLGHIENMDVALLKLDRFPKSGKALIKGDSSKIKNGQTVYHIGNSLGEGLCITSGIVSDKDRIICGNHRIMTDVAINPGNSGGPLINSECEVVGICVSARVGAVGMKYSIPINDAFKFLGK